MLVCPLLLPQSALFALAVADIVLVNMWAKDIGRETGAGKPLLKTIFQVNLKLFQVGQGVLPGRLARCITTAADGGLCTWQVGCERRAWPACRNPRRFHACLLVSCSHCSTPAPLPPPPQPAPNRRRTVLLFVFRDRTKTPLEKLVETWEADLGRMWDAIAKPPQARSRGWGSVVLARALRGAAGGCSVGGWFMGEVAEAVLLSDSSWRQRIAIAR